MDVRGELHASVALTVTYWLRGLIVISLCYAGSQTYLIIHIRSFY